MENTYILNIQGTSFAIRSDEPEEYIRYLEGLIKEKIEAITVRGASSHKAALFVCMELIDSLEKQKKAEELSSSKKQKKQLPEVFCPDENQVSLF